MNALGSASPERRRWRRTLRTGLFWTALGFGAACISYACDPDVAARSLGFDRALSILFLALVPIPALALGVHGLALALRLRAAAGLADRTAEELATLLPEGFVVVPHYRPSDVSKPRAAHIHKGRARVSGIALPRSRKNTAEMTPKSPRCPNFAAYESRSVVK